ncbi:MULTISPECIES: CdaR family transcriptional regulator [unclassified Rhodococcus (in: high G+C Gram-positive bacteria)]|uniref:PucR family transcriptional regulator n=1 Tax=unclassified Rhodococcus (in: high G+C Gram-positive bacteria) TaxID=192944 RepID=UPI0012E97187|nr:MULTISPECIES: PucR family transcriptional regulator [unclassified Rhodococcus (in: high G+C Gram-positive bacteria)]WML60979.1 helix-turn-helix domain-containing protein [Rhodococcus sp. AH-ZY2]
MHSRNSGGSSAVIGEHPDVDPAVRRILDNVQSRINALAKSPAAGDQHAFQSLPVDFRHEEIPQLQRRYFRILVQAIRKNVPFGERDLQMAQQIAADRAIEGVPLTLVLRNWQNATSILWNACTEAARDDEAKALSYIGRTLMALEQEILGTVTTSYLVEREAIASGERGAVHLVAQTLVSGRDPHAEAERLDIELAPGYDVMAVQFDAFEGEVDTQYPGRQIAHRRKLRKILRTLGEYRGAYPVLATLDSHGGHVLVPQDETATATTEEVGRDLVDRMRVAAGVNVTASHVDSVSFDDLPRAAKLSTEILEIVISTNRPPGLYRLSDVALVYQLAHPTAATRYFADLLAPLEPHPELLETLDHYLFLDFDRGRTARRLKVHPNTVNNRLHRITTLTGCDPSRFDGIMLLGAALSIREVSR